jgi:hypothetical protein
MTGVFGFRREPAADGPVAGKARTVGRNVIRLKGTVSSGKFWRQF